MHSSNLKKHMATHNSEQFSLELNDSNDAINDKIVDVTESTVISGKMSKKNIAKPHKCEHCDRAFVSR